MSFTVSTDHDEITAALDRFLAADPVTGTLLGTIRLGLRDTAWCALTDDAIAVRSADEWPVALAGTWTAPARRELVRALAALPDLHGLTGPEELVGELTEAVAGGRRVRSLLEALHRCTELIPARSTDGAARRADPGDGDDRALVRAWFAAFVAETHDFTRDTAAEADRLLDSGGCWLWVDGDGNPVALANRRPVVAGSARIGPVYTPPEYRGRGYAGAVTAAATADVIADGGIPVLFTDLANPISNRVYKNLGYEQIERRLFVILD